MTATSIREEAMKRMTKQSRKGSESDDPDDDEEEEESCDKAPLRRKKRVPRSVNDAIRYLQEKAKKDYSLKMEEMNLRKKELKRKKISQLQQETLITMLKQMQQQQQNQQNLQAMLIAQQRQ